MGMFGKRFQLNEETIHIVEEIGRHYQDPDQKTPKKKYYDW